MPPPTFLGRATEVARAVQGIDTALSGSGALLFMVGEAGIGKTRLAHEVTRRANERGFRVAWGRCWEAGGAPALWPWTQVFRSLGAGDPFEAEAGATIDTQELRFRQFDRAARQLETLASDAPLAIVLDDLHMADIASLGLLHPTSMLGAQAAVLLGDHGLASRLYALLSAPTGDIDVFWGPWAGSCIGPSQRILGDLAAMLGRTDEARALYDQAITMAERIGAVPLIKLAEDARAALGGAKRAIASPPPRSIALVRQGAVWTITSFSGATVRLKDGKGVRYLDKLLASPDRDLHVVDLVGLDEPAGDAGPLLDAEAKCAYRRRLEDLRAALEEAKSFGDYDRAARAQEELDAIGSQLAAAVGLGGRDRVAASVAQRARVNVQRRLRDVLARIEQQDPVLGRYLKSAVRTGTYCCYAPH